MFDLLKLNDSDLTERERLEYQALAKLEGMAREARRDPVKFIEFVYRDERDRTITVEPFQREWIDSVLSNKRNIILAPPEHGKTVIFTVLLRLWELGHNPKLRCALIMQTATMSEKVVATLEQYIEGPEWSRLHLVFPDLVPARKPSGTRLAWRHDTFQIDTGDGQVEERSVLELLLSDGVPAKDRTYQSFGNFGKVDAGRYDRIDLDDVMTFDNTRTKDQRDKFHNWLLETVVNRLVADGRITWLSNAWHENDALHREMRKGTWAVIRQAAVNPEFANGGEITFILWEKQWTPERLYEKLKELGPVIFLRKFCNQAFDENTRLFHAAWIAACLRRGRGLHFEHDKRGGSNYTGVDLATRKSKKSDLSAFVTIAEQANQDRLLLNIESGRIVGPEIVDKVKNHSERYDSLITVEDNAAQAYILQFTRDTSDALVSPFTTGSNKWDERYGILSLSVEMFNEKWIIPSGDWNGDDSLTDLSGLHPEVAGWITEMLTFTLQDHTGDRLMASWFAREGLRSGRSEFFNHDYMSR